MRVCPTVAYIALGQTAVGRGREDSFLSRACKGENSEMGWRGKGRGKGGYRTAISACLVRGSSLSSATTCLFTFLPTHIPDPLENRANNRASAHNCHTQLHILRGCFPHRARTGPTFAPYLFRVANQHLRTHPLSCNLVASTVAWSGLDRSSIASWNVHGLPNEIHKPRGHELPHHSPPPPLPQ